MSKLIKLNPYQSIVTDVDAFFTRVYEAIKTLSLRQDPIYKGHIREINFGTLVKTDGQATGIINVHVLNLKYAAANLKTNRLKPKFSKGEFSESTVTPEFFVTEFVDESDVLEIRVSFNQFESKAMALSPVRFSTLYHVKTDEGDAALKAVASKEVISYMWEDSAIVLSTKDFFDLVKPVMSAWTPAIKDITGETIFVA